MLVLLLFITICLSAPLYNRWDDHSSERHVVIYDQRQLDEQLQSHIAEQSVDLDEYLARQLSEESALKQFDRRF